MILAELKRYIEEKGTVSQLDLAKRFAISEDGVDAMLSVWIKKGKISRLVDTNSIDQVTRVRYTKLQSDSLAMTVTM